MWGGTVGRTSACMIVSGILATVTENLRVIELGLRCNLLNSERCFGREFCDCLLASDSAGTEG